MQRIGPCPRNPEQTSAWQEAKAIVLANGTGQRHCHWEGGGLQVKLEESGKPVSLLAVKEAACTGPDPCHKSPEGIEPGFIARAAEPGRGPGAQQPVQHKRAARLGACPGQPLAAERLNADH